jgi:hypothetical protein
MLVGEVYSAGTVEGPITGFLSTFSLPESMDLHDQPSNYEQYQECLTPWLQFHIL